MQSAPSVQFRPSALSAFREGKCSSCDITMSHLPRFCPSKADFALDTYRPVRKHPNQRRVIGGEWRKDWVEVSSSGREKGGREKRRLKEGQESILAISLTLIVHHILITSLNVPASEQIYRLSPHSDNPLFRDTHKQAIALTKSIPTKRTFGIS